MIYSNKNFSCYLYFLQRGFSLTELMIVVAIIGIIVSIAVPNYQNYVDRAKVTQMIAMVDPCQNAIYQPYVENGDFPGSIICQGVTLNKLDTKSSQIPSSRIYVQYSIIDEVTKTINGATATSPKTARLTLQHLDVNENNTVCSLLIDISENATVNGNDLLQKCSVVNCSSKSIFPTNCF